MVIRFPVFGFAFVAVLLIPAGGYSGGAGPVQQPSPEEQSLGEKARELKAQRTQQSKPAKVFTNDSLSTGSGVISVVGAGQTPSGAGSGSTEEGSQAEHGEHYYRKTMSDLQARLELHQRQLEVLKQKLDINQLQYYPDPYKTLQQEYSRSDIEKLQAEIEAKQQEIEADQRAISDLTAQLQRDGGDPGWLRSAPASGTNLEKQEREAAEEGPKGKPGTREYWQGRFKSAHAKLAKAQEIQQLAEDELSLLQTQQAREVLNADVAVELAQRISAKQTEADSARTATQKAVHELEELKQEFTSSGAPEEWSEEP